MTTNELFLTALIITMITSFFIPKTPINNTYQKLKTKLYTNYINTTHPQPPNTDQQDIVETLLTLAETIKQSKGKAQLTITDPTPLTQAAQEIIKLRKQTHKHI